MRRIGPIRMIEIGRGALVLLLIACVGPIRNASAELTLEQIMADPDWMGNAPQGAYFADDGKSIYYRQKRVGERETDLIEIDLKGKRKRIVADEALSEADVAGGELSDNGKQKVYALNDDLFVKTLRSGKIRQLTRTREAESAPRFMAGDDAISFRRGRAIYVRELESGLEYQAADLRAEDEPEEKKRKEERKFDFLKSQQEKLFEIVRERKSRADRASKRSRERQAADDRRVDSPFYFGADVEIRRSELSPSGDWMLVTLVKKMRDAGKRDSMPNYVTSDGYVASRQVRTKVGTGDAPAERVILLDLANHKSHELDLDALPGIKDDPLKELREAAEAARKAEAEKAEAESTTGETEKDEDSEKDEEKSDEPQARPVSARGFVWNEDGSRVALQFFSADHKDRWVATIDLESKALVPLERFSDPAWINGRFAQLGWLRRGDSIYYVSEHSGYAHLYTRSAEAGASEHALTEGNYEVSQPYLARDGKHIYYTANKHHPGETEFYRVRVRDGKTEQITDLGGRNRARLSNDEKRIVITHSSLTSPPELYVQWATPGAKAARLTHTASDAFTSIEWIRPEIVEIDSSHSDDPIYARVYSPPDEAPSGGGERPVVIFVHGAGYLQNAHKGWSSYFREFMFHTLLARKGFVVLDMDYRASAGYGRDWRTAIYRRMGTPELEDFEDGIRWLTTNKNIDPARVGLYGGSYGGFMTLMALFIRPDLYACGAALRPVTDWAHYNDPYTSNILNTPTVDPEAYRVSSPIEYAEGLEDPLLICHGMQDDNVFFQDTVRLVQRLIELGKQNFETAIYPIEPHGFREPSSWLDEYRRILKLFETHLLD